MSKKINQKFSFWYSSFFLFHSDVLNLNVLRPPSTPPQSAKEGTLQTDEENTMEVTEVVVTKGKEEKEEKEEEKNNYYDATMDEDFQALPTPPTSTKKKKKKRNTTTTTTNNNDDNNDNNNHDGNVWHQQRCLPTASLQ